MTTIVKISRVIKHHEDVLLIERIEPENDSISRFVLPIDGSVEIEIFGKNVSQLIERDTPKKLKKLLGSDQYHRLVGICGICGQDVYWHWEYCPYCANGIDWSE